MSAGGIIGIAVVLAIAIGVAVRRRALERKTVAWLRARYGVDVSLVSMCVAVTGFGRFRAVICLTGDAVAWRSVVFNRARIGEIPLAAVDLVMWEDARTGWLKRLAGGPAKQLLTLRDRDGRESRFVLDNVPAVLWDKVLEVKVGALTDDQSTED